MLALVLDRQVHLKSDYQTPQRGSGEALIAMCAAGICDTDIQLASGYMDYRGVLGHEFVGKVIEADDARWVGRRVVADINAGCGTCLECEHGDPHHCSGRTVLGILGRDGALAERLAVPERCLVEVPDRVDDERAVFAEPLAAAMHVLDVPGVRRARDATVVGDGKLGQLIARALASQGVAVTLIGHHPDKLALATKAGVKGLLEKDAPEGASATFVVDATGSASGLSRAIALTRPRGTLVLKTTVAGAVSVDLAPVVINEINVVGSRCGDMRAAIDALATARVDPKDLIAARYSLREADRALEHARKPGTLKVVVTSP